MMEQLQLFSHPNTYNPTPYYQDISKVRYDPYWDEITREPEEQFLMAVNDGELPSNAIRNRDKGNGTGRITARLVSKKGKNYKEYWYDWQYFVDGRRIGRSRYIPKRLLPQIQALESEKVPVSKILEVLGVGH